MLNLLSQSFLVFPMFKAGQYHFPLKWVCPVWAPLCWPQCLQLYFLLFEDGVGERTNWGELDKVVESGVRGSGSGSCRKLTTWPWGVLVKVEEGVCWRTICIPWLLTCGELDEVVEPEGSGSDCRKLTTSPCIWGVLHSQAGVERGIEASWVCIEDGMEAGARKISETIRVPGWATLRLEVSTWGEK